MKKLVLLIVLVLICLIPIAFPINAMNLEKKKNLSSIDEVSNILNNGSTKLNSSKKINKKRIFKKNKKNEVIVEKLSKTDFLKNNEIIEYFEDGRIKSYCIYKDKDRKIKTDGCFEYKGNNSYRTYEFNKSNIEDRVFLTRDFNDREIVIYAERKSYFKFYAKLENGGIVESDNLYTCIETKNSSDNIINAFINRDKQYVLNHLNYKSDRIPRKSFLNRYSFEEIFDEEFISFVINTKIVKEMGFEGFMFDNGHIWIDGETILSCSIELDEDFFNLKHNKNRKLYVDGKKVPVNKFYIPYVVSGDNEEAITYRLKEYKKDKEFRTHPGEYLDIILKNKKSFIDDDGSYLGQVLFPFDDIGNLKEDYERSIGYILLAELKSDICKKFASNMKHECEKVVAIETEEGSGGSYGWEKIYSIHGIFLINGRKHIMPLLFLSSKEDLIELIEKEDALLLEKAENK